MNAEGYVLLEDLGALALVNAGHLEDLSCVQVAVRAPPHDADPADHHLVHWYGRVHGEVDVQVPLHAARAATAEGQLVASAVALAQVDSSRQEGHLLGIWVRRPIPTRRALAHAAWRTAHRAAHSHLVRRSAACPRAFVRVGEARLAGAGTSWRGRCTRTEGGPRSTRSRVPFVSRARWCERETRPPRDAPGGRSLPDAIWANLTKCGPFSSPLELQHY